MNGQTRFGASTSAAGRSFVTMAVSAALLAACGGSDEVDETADAASDGSITNTDSFMPEDTDVPPEPALSGLTPACGPAVGGTETTITGNDFVAGAAVSLGETSASATSVVDSQTITALTPPSSGGALSTVDVTVAQGGQAATLIDGFRYHGNVEWIAVSEPYPTDFREFSALGDIDGDGFADRALSLTGGIRIERRFNDATGTFDEIALNTDCTEPSALAIGDVTGDGLADIIAGCQLTLEVLRGSDGAAPTEGISSVLTDNIGTYYVQLALGDLDGDGDLDVAIRRQNNGVLQLAFNDGTGAFALAPATIDTGDDLSWVGLVDLTGDGINDLATVRYAPGEFAVRPGVGDGTFGAPILSAIPSLQTISFGDYNDDDQLDAVVGSNAPAVGASVYFNNNGSFSENTVIQGGGLVGTSALDADDDGKLDIVVSDGDRFRAYITGSELNSDCLLESLETPAMYVLNQGDLNNDGIPDLTGHNPNAAEVLIMHSRRIGAAN